MTVVKLRHGTSVVMLFVLTDKLCLFFAFAHFCLIISHFIHFLVLLFVFAPPSSSFVIANENNKLHSKILVYRFDNNTTTHGWQNLSSSTILFSSFNRYLICSTACYFCWVLCCSAIESSNNTHIRNYYATKMIRFIMWCEYNSNRAVNHHHKNQIIIIRIKIDLDATTTYREENFHTQSLCSLRIMIIAINTNNRTSSVSATRLVDREALKRLFLSALSTHTTEHSTCHLYQLLIRDERIVLAKAHSRKAINKAY